MPSTQMLSVCVGIFAVILFSGTFPATKLALELYSPIHATCLRSSCASLFAIIFLVLVKLKNQSKQEKFNTHVSSEHKIREMLELNNPIYEITSAYGHFGRKPEKKGQFTWEKTDKVDLFKL